MGLPVETRRYTITEYLAMEETARDRHEFHDGEILAMSGGTYKHSRIASNMLCAIHSRLKGTTCHPLGCGMRLRIPGRPYYIYPDISVLCEPPKFDEGDPKQTTIVNPRVVVEVLSEATEGYDRGEKFQFYQRVPSLEEYILVSQSTPLVESFLRGEGGSWKYTAAAALQLSALISSLKLFIPLNEIYDGVSFD